LKSIGEFSGDGKENIINWVAGIEAIGRLLEIDEKTIVKATILSLRLEAKTWGISFIGSDIELNWERLKEGLISRFSNTRESDETLARFLNTYEAKTYDDLIQLLKDAKMINLTKGISTSHLMRQVIARVPAGIKSILLHNAQSGSSWDEFLKQGEDAAWMAFPEKITGRISSTNGDMSENQCNAFFKKNQQRAGPSRRYCHLHGEGSNSTKFCKVIQQLEKQGWKKTTSNKSINQVEISEEIEESGDNKMINNYSTCLHSINTISNPFFYTARFNGQEIPVLIDTGADVSLINIKHIDINKITLKPSEEKLRSACGTPMEMMGKLHDAKITIGDHTLKWSPLVIKNKPSSYVILGIDTILTNKHAIEQKILSTLKN
ncbi:hypothetical protein ENBRE01_1972, partial [Enteropsectra breve]